MPRRFRNDDTLGIAIGNFANEMNALYVAQRDTLIFADEASKEGLGKPSEKLLKFGLFFLITTWMAASMCSLPMATSNPKSTGYKRISNTANRRNSSGIKVTVKARALSPCRPRNVAMTCSNPSSGAGRLLPTLMVTGTSMSFLHKSADRHYCCGTTRIWAITGFA